MLWAVEVKMCVASAVQRLVEVTTVYLALKSTYDQCKDANDPAESIQYTEPAV